jgi:carbonic anhydrase/acetyltransferase-like protein (isoleucine patch superfamily)
MTANLGERPYIEVLGDLAPTIDPTAFIHPRATVIGDVTLGPDSSIWPGAILRGDEGFIKVGAATNIQDGTLVHTTGNLSNTIIGDRVTVGHGAIIHGAVIGEYTLIGMGAILLDNAQIGAHCVVGAGSLITKNLVVPPRSVVFGRPPNLVIRPIGDKELERNEYSWRRYMEQAKRYLDEGRQLQREDKP